MRNWIRFAVKMVFSPRRALSDVACLLRGRMPEAKAPIAPLLDDFMRSLRPDQVHVFMDTLDMGQKLAFMEIANLMQPEPVKPQPPDLVQDLQALFGETFKQ